MAKRMLSDIILSTRDGRVRFVRFLVVGGINTLFGYLCFAGSIGLLHLPLAWALLFSQLAGILFNFNSYGKLVFHSSHGPKSSRFVRFLVVYAGMYLLNLGILDALAAFGGSPYLSQGLALIVIVPLTYVLLRSLVWKSSGKYKETK